MLDFSILVNNIDFIITGFLGFFLRIALSLFGQKWVNTIQYFQVFIILPVITFVITKVISGNIPLALGMVGALSIVRFRNPVKNTYELVIYFGLITIGIANSVSIKYGIFLTAFIILVSGFSFYFDKITKKINKNYFSVSFSEGQNNNILEITLKANVRIDYAKEFLLELNKDFDLMEFNYKYISNNINDLKKISNYFEENHQNYIKNINLNNLV